MDYRKLEDRIVISITKNRDDVYVSIEDPRLDGVKLMIEKVESQKPRMIYDSVSKCCGRKVAKKLFCKLVESCVWLGNPEVEEVIAK